jgi:nucleoside-diphosphate-sugar epimerase
VGQDNFSPRKKKMQTSKTHVVLGAGQVGPLLAQELLGRGLKVRVVSRRATGDAQERLEFIQGDLTDLAFTQAACQGAEVVYNCTNPAEYHQWDKLLPPLTRSIREAAIRTKSKLVVLDNLYMVGRPETAPFNEDHPMKPCSKKGELRKQLVEEYLSASARGDLQVTLGRASDFFGPGAAGMSAFGEHLGRALAKKKPVEVFGNPDLPRSYSYIPDVAKGLAILGTQEGAFGKVWHLPIAWNGTTRELIGKIGEAAGIKATVRKVPDFMLGILGLFMPQLGAIREMTYQWKAPFLVDDSRFCKAFGVEATPAHKAISATAQYLKRAYIEK